jgi:hypothetical protein
LAENEEDRALGGTDLVVGLARNVCLLITELIAQGALDGEKALKTFRAFAANQHASEAGVETKFFADQIVRLLEQRPAGTVLEFLKPSDRD